MRDFEVRRKDGKFALLNRNGEFIDGVLVKDTGGTVAVWATARTDKGQAFYVQLPVSRAMLEQAPEMIEERLRFFAERWEQSRNVSSESNV